MPARYLVLRFSTCVWTRRKVENSCKEATVVSMH